MNHKIKLSNVTLAGVDCLNIDRLIDVSRICERHIDFGAVKLFSSIKSSYPHVVPVEHLGCHEDCSRFLIKALNNFIDTDFVLIIEYDGFILNPFAWDERFLQFDYIGAPWPGGGMDVGNGGFSLRSKKLLESLAGDDEITQCHPEDTAIGKRYRRRLEEKAIRFAPTELASNFSFEANTTRGIKWNGQFGFHSYSTNLDSWDYTKFTDDSDQRFISHFKQMVAGRQSRKIDKEVTSAIVGSYKSVTSQDIVVQLHSNGSDLVSSLGGKNKIYHPVDEITYVCDAANELMLFEFNEEDRCILIEHIDFNTRKTDHLKRELTTKEFETAVDLNGRTFPHYTNPFRGQYTN